DIVLNVGDMSLETASEIVACVASRKEYKWTPETAGVVRDFAIKNRVRAHLRFRSHYAEVVVNAQVHKSVVRLSGDAAFEAAKTEIAQFVRTVAGVERVALEREETAVLPGERTARELMIPISRYPNIRQSMQIRDAFIALGGSSVKLDDGHLIPPRYLLVFDDRDTLVGVLTRRDLLRGLSPEIRILERALESVAGVLPTQHADMGPQPGWTSLFSHAALQNARESVRSLMRGVKGVVNVEDPLSVVVRTMLTCEVDLVPVMEGQKAVGVVLMTDIFDAVTQFVTEGEPRRVR
ncbi:MAG: CBS domain-containing protein, partial [Polyangiaceae bacterium]|nr:CBS domain-containing protein [Polyangiaceae bacterium]